MNIKTYKEWNSNGIIEEDSSSVCLVGGDWGVLWTAPGEMQAAWIKDRRAAGPADLRQPALRHAGKDLQPYSTRRP